MHTKRGYPSLDFFLFVIYFLGEFCFIKGIIHQAGGRGGGHFLCTCLQGKGEFDALE